MSNNFSVRAKFGSENVVFHLRLISIAEEKSVRDKFLTAKDDETFGINVDVLAQFSTSPPTTEYEKNLPGESAEDAVRDYFADKGTVKQRIAQSVIGAFLMKQVPEIDFL